MLHLPTVKNLYLRTIIARVFCLDTEKNGSLVIRTPLKDKKESEISFD